MHIKSSKHTSGKLKLLEKKKTEMTIAEALKSYDSTLIETLSTKLGIASANVIAATRDRASVNSVAMRTIKVVYPKIFDVGCYSHTLDHVGEKMDTLILNEFIKGWISLFAHSPKTRLAWSSLTGLPPPTYSAVRWWSKYEVIKQVHDAFGDVSSFLRSDSLPSISAEKLRGILDDPAKCRKLKIELAITVDAMTPFVSSTYLLEGDGPLIFIAYREISKLHAAISWTLSKCFCCCYM